MYYIWTNTSNDCKLESVTDNIESKSSTRELVDDKT